MRNSTAEYFVAANDLNVQRGVISISASSARGGQRHLISAIMHMQILFEQYSWQPMLDSTPRTAIAGSKTFKGLTCFCINVSKCLTYKC